MRVAYLVIIISLVLLLNLEVHRNRELKSRFAQSVNVKLEGPYSLIPGLALTNKQHCTVIDDVQHRRRENKRLSCL